MPSASVDMTNKKYFPLESERFAKALRSFKGQKVAVIGHLRPDGDCIGSTVALVRLLNEMGVAAIGLNQDAVPERFKVFVGETPLIQVSSFQPDGHIAVTVDCADCSRIGDQLNQHFPQIALNIDHHISNKSYAGENIVDGAACATAEILAGCCFDNGYTIDPSIAQALYLGIVTDTGQFRFLSTSPATFEIVHRLCHQGVQPAKVASELYENQSPARLRLLQTFLASIRMELGGRVCVGLLEEGIHKVCGSSSEDVDGLVDYVRSIKGVDIGILLEAQPGSIKGSLRAKDPFYRVDQLAEQFNGGGHACAAGLNVEGSSLSSCLPRLLEVVDRHLKKLEISGS